MLSSDSPVNIRSRIIPFELLRLLCCEAETFKLKNDVIFSRFSVCDLRFVSTSKVLFFNFLTDFGVLINDSICFTIIKGDKEVTGLEPS